MNGQPLPIGRPGNPAELWLDCPSDGAQLGPRVEERSVT
jgi:hypothetical protein